MPINSRWTSVVVVGLVGELSLGCVGALVAHWTGIDWMARLPRTRSEGAEQSLVGVVAAWPTLVFLAWALHTSWGLAARLRELAEQMFGPLLADIPWAILPLLAAAAAVGEEILFRGALQPWIAGKSGLLLAWLAVSLLFGAAHAVSRSYFLFAACIGGYLGWLSNQYGLWPAIVVHFVYDLVALIALKNRRPVAFGTRSE